MREPHLQLQELEPEPPPRRIPEDERPVLPTKQPGRILDPLARAWYETLHPHVLKESLR